VLIGFGLTNISLGIIAEYVWRTLDASRDRPVFIIENMIDCESSEKKAGMVVTSEETGIKSS
jgi:dolichol-phosphate mannosyltransferase